jgi:hypothetical protein
MGCANDYHVIHHEGGSRKTYIWVREPRIVGVTKTYKQVYHTIASKIWIWNTSLGIQRNQMIAWSYIYDPLAVTITPKCNASACTFARGLVEARSFLRTPKP